MTTSQPPSQSPDRSSGNPSPAPGAGAPAAEGDEFQLRLREGLVFPVLFVCAFAGAAIGFWLGEPSGWSDSAPRAIVLTGACIVAGYLLLVAWEGQFDDRHRVVAMKRVVELVVPAVLLGAVWTSAALEITDYGDQDKGDNLAAMLGFTLAVIVLLWLVAPRVTLQVSANRDGGSAPEGDSSDNSS